VNTGVGPDGVRREFGVPVTALKPIPAALAGVVAGAGNSSAAAGAASAAPAKGKAAKGAAVAAAAKDVDDDDDMALLDALVVQSKSCGAAGCGKSTQTTGTTCPHCHLRFCYAHGQPEVHGCGDAARAKARGDWHGTAGAGAGKALPEWKRDNLARQLHKKIDSAASDRTPKGKDEGGGSKKKGGK
jgi:ATP-dependent RNA/DNA helicase IGHMBP2